MGIATERQEQQWSGKWFVVYQKLWAGAALGLTAVKSLWWEHLRPMTCGSHEVCSSGRTAAEQREWWQGAPKQ
jgi:hypothetical protein